MLPKDTGLAGDLIIDFSAIPSFSRQALVVVVVVTNVSVYSLQL